jgi:predicted RNA-binding Zn-ribbon protein involved in translation (DUF1610 family)
MFENLRRALEEISNTTSFAVEIAADGKGYIDKQCPRDDCEFLFKIFEADWKTKPDDAHIHCPMCGESASANQWFTKAQVEHAKSEAVAVFQGKLNQAMRQDAQSFNSKRSNSFVQMSMSVHGGHTRTYSVPASASAEMQLEIECSECISHFSVIGSAYFCPSCGKSSVLRCFEDSIRKMRVKKANVGIVRAAITEAGDPDGAEMTVRSMMESCLADGVTALQRFCEGLFPHDKVTKIPRNVFQRLDQGSHLWQQVIGKGYDEFLTTEERSHLQLLFQRRHLFAHQEGLVDDEYVERSGDTAYKPGQRIVVTERDVDAFADILLKLASGLRSSVANSTQLKGDPGSPDSA